MRAIQGFRGEGGKRAEEEREAIMRRGLLAKVHIGAKQLGLTEVQYTTLLRGQFGLKVTSAGDLSIRQLEQFIKTFKDLGWRPPRSRKRVPGGNRVLALKERVLQEAGELAGGDRRLAGIVKNVFHVDRFDWLRDEGQLKRLLAILKSIKTREEEAPVEDQGKLDEGKS